MTIPPRKSRIVLPWTTVPRFGSAVQPCGSGNAPVPEAAEPISDVSEMAVCV